MPGKTINIGSRAGGEFDCYLATPETDDLVPAGEFVPGYEASVLDGFGVPKDTPVEIINKLNMEINAALADPKMKARLADLGGTVLGGSPADFGKLIAAETEKWGKVVKFSDGWDVRQDFRAQRSGDAKACSMPALMYSIAALVVGNVNCTWPPSRSVIAG